MGDKQGRESGMKIEADDDEESEERVRARWDWCLQIRLNKGILMRRIRKKDPI
jgi:hypothetical protein